MRVSPTICYVIALSCEDEHWPAVARVEASSELAVWYDAWALAQVISPSPAPIFRSARQSGRTFRLAKRKGRSSLSVLVGREDRSDSVRMPKAKLSQIQSGIYSSEAQARPDPSEMLCSMGTYSNSCVASKRSRMWRKHSPAWRLVSIWTSRAAHQLVMLHS